MTKNDSNSDPLEQADPLSATGMFLSSFGSTPTPSQESPEAGAAKPDPFATSGPGTTRTDWPAPSPSHPSPTSSATGPGEFTQMFQAMETRPSPPPVSQPPAASQAAQPAPSQSAGEFTRIFVSDSTVSGSTPPTEHRIPEQGARTVVEPPHIPPPASNPSRMKGFSTPGVSDSASAEGSFTQFFKATPAAAASTPSPAPAVPSPSAPSPAQSYRPPMPAPPPPMAEKPWQREPEFGSITKPADAPPSSPSATGLLSALSSPGGASYSSRQPEVTPYRPEPLPSYTPPPPAEPSAMEAGSVTKLIQRLSQVPRETPPAPIIPVAAAATPPPVSSSFGEPGEFTRMISGDTVKAALGTAPATAPTPSPAVPAPIAIQHLAVPAAPAIAPPAMPAPKAAAPPKIELPKIAPPAAPAFAAPKGKLEAMVPILLVVNTFLLVVLLVVVIFALKAK